MSQHEQYLNPPLVEAVLELRFSRDSFAWDTLVPSKFFDALQSRYPKHSVRIGLEMGTVEGDQSIGQKIQAKGPYTRYTNESGSERVQLSPSSLTITQNPPYPSWMTFRKRIEQDIIALSTILELPPATRIGLRYVNKVRMSSDRINIEDYLETPPSFPHFEGMDGIYGWVSRYQVSYDDGTNGMNVLIGSVPLEDSSEELAFSLDMDYATRTTQIHYDDWFAWIDIAHNRIKEVFESVLTEECKKIFKTKLG